eukprot:6184939-Pleurochrysis_carterae.AAC.4
MSDWGATHSPSIMAGLDQAHKLDEFRVWVTASDVQSVACFGHAGRVARGQERTERKSRFSGKLDCKKGLAPIGVAIPAFCTSRHRFPRGDYASVF